MKIRTSFHFSEPKSFRLFVNHLYISDVSFFLQRKSYRAVRLPKGIYQIVQQGNRLQSIIRHFSKKARKDKKEQQPTTHSSIRLEVYNNLIWRLLLCVEVVVVVVVVVLGFTG